MKRPKKPKNLIGIDQFSDYLYKGERNLLDPSRRRNSKRKYRKKKPRENNDDRKAYMKNWRKENKERINQYYNDWCRDNPDKKSKINAKYRLKKFLEEKR